MTKESSDLLLLDLNVLLAIAWPNHQFHASAVSALSGEHRWATCALTQIGFIRLSSNRAAIPGARTPAEAAELLGRLVADPLHLYLEMMPPPTTEWRKTFGPLMGHQQVMDGYLLRLAAGNNAVFVTFDRKLKSLAGDETRVLVLE